MSSKNRFLQTLIAVAALTPAASAVAGNADNGTPAAASYTARSEVAFADNLAAKLGDTLSDAEALNEAGVGKPNFVRIVFVQAVPPKPQAAPRPAVGRISPIDAFNLASIPD